MDKKIYKKFMDCIEAMRKNPKDNWVIGLSSNDRYKDVCYLDIFRTGTNSYTIRFNSPVKGCSWCHEDMYLRHALGAIETWFYDLKNINKDKYMEY